MNIACNEIREMLYRQGWNPQQRAIETAAGGTVWVVFNNQAHRSFSIQANNPQEAWESAWRLVGKIRKPEVEPCMILPFPTKTPAYPRAI
jgi:hypothetical protein